jgi:hypothetical protein
VPRHEPSQRAEPGEVLAAGKVVMRRTKDGRIEFVPPPPREEDGPEQAEGPPEPPSSTAP